MKKQITLNSKKIEAKKLKAVKLLNEIIDLRYKNHLLTAKRFSITEENLGTKKEPKIVKVKWMHWEEEFMDEDSGKPFKIERQQPVLIGETKYFNKITPVTYYSLKDI